MNLLLRQLFLLRNPTAQEVQLSAKSEHVRHRYEHATQTALLLNEPFGHIDTQFEPYKLKPVVQLVQLEAERHSEQW